MDKKEEMSVACVQMGYGISLNECEPNGGETIEAKTTNLRYRVRISGRNDCYKDVRIHGTGDGRSF